MRLSYNAGLESPSAKGTVFWLVNSGSSASCTPFSWQRTRRVRPDQAVTAVEQISLWLHLEGVVRPGTTCDPRSYAESWGLRRKSRLGGLEYLDSPSPFPPATALSGAILRHMKVEEIAEAIAKLPPDQLARFRRWFTAFEAGRADHAKELDSTATKLGRLAGRAFAELKKRGKEL